MSFESIVENAIGKLHFLVLRLEEENKALKAQIKTMSDRLKELDVAKDKVIEDVKDKVAKVESAAKRIKAIKDN